MIKNWISLVTFEFCVKKWEFDLCVKASAVCSLCLSFCAPSWLAFTSSIISLLRSLNIPIW